MPVNATNIAAQAATMTVVITLLAAAGYGLYRMSEPTSLVEQLPAAVERLHAR